MRLALIPVVLVVSVFVSYEWQRFLFLFAFFLLGYAADLNRDTWSSVTSKWWVIAASTILAGVTFVAASSGIPVRYQAAWALGVLAGVVSLAALAKALPRFALSRPLAFVGRSSLIFYVTHWSVLLVTYHLLDRLGLSNAIALFALTLISGLVSGVVMTFLAKRFAVVNLLYEFPLPKTPRANK